MLKTRWLAVALCAASVAGACGGGGSSDSKSSSDTKGGGADASDCPVDALATATAPVEITMWYAISNKLEDELKKLAEAYNASQSKVKVNLVYQGSYDDAIDKYLAALRSKTKLPQVVQLEETQTQVGIDSQSFVPISACIKADNYDTSDYLDRVISYFTFDGVQVAMPFNTSNPVLYYNKAMFTQAGLDPEKPPTTLEEVRTASEKIVASGAAKHGISIEFQPWYIEQMLAKEGLEAVNNDNGRSERATEARFDQPEVAEIFQWLQDMTKDDLALSVGLNPQGIDHFLAVASKDAAMTIGTSAALGTVKQVIAAGQVTGVEVGVAPMPGLSNDPTKGGVMVGGAELWITKSSSDEQIAAAWDFLKFLDSPESQAQWHLGTGYVPIRKSAIEAADVKAKWAAEPEYSVAFKQLDSGVTNVGSSGIVMGPYNKVRDLLETAMGNVIDGKDVAAEMEKLQTEATAVLQDYAQRTGG